MGGIGKGLEWVFFPPRKASFSLFSFPSLSFVVFFSSFLSFPVAGQHNQALFSSAASTSVTVSEECALVGLEGIRFWKQKKNGGFHRML